GALDGHEGCAGGNERMTTYEEFRKKHPWLLRWEGFKLTVSEWWHGLWR
ncbi:unnamed protein product, partial [marine sediment metagenome]